MLRQRIVLLLMQTKLLLMHTKLQFLLKVQSRQNNKTYTALPSFIHYGMLDMHRHCYACTVCGASNIPYRRNKRIIG
jgi:hypothetical protein